MRADANVSQASYAYTGRHEALREWSRYREKDGAQDVS